MNDIQANQISRSVEFIALYKADELKLVSSI